MYLISIIEKKLEKKAIKNYLPLQRGDIKNTKSNTEKLKRAIKISPNTPIEKGVEKFIDWFIEFYK